MYTVTISTEAVSFTYAYERFTEAVTAYRQECDWNAHARVELRSSKWDHPLSERHPL